MMVPVHYIASKTLYFLSSNVLPDLDPAQPPAQSLTPHAQYKENETLYFQRVPPAIDLAPPAPALLVAAVPPPPELDQPEEKWFAFLSGALRRTLNPDPDPDPDLNLCLVP